jgi:2'-5' RNA ligase
MSFFLAIDLDEPVRAEVWNFSSPHHQLPAKWLRRDKLHLTLVFLGEPSAQVLAPLKAKVERLIEGLPPFSLRLANAGLFETARAPAVLWLGVDGERARLGELQRRLSLGLSADLDRPYVPHLTLARSKHAHAFAEVLPVMQSFTSREFAVNHVTLFQSTEANYQALWQVKLSARTAQSTQVN